MDRTIVARWLDWSGEGIQHLVVRTRSGVIVAEGAILGAEVGRAFAATYRIACDAAWHVRMARVRLIGADVDIDLTSDGAGHWRDANGKVLPDLDGALDIDVSATPFTNTLPIRRLDLAEGQSAD